MSSRSSLTLLAALAAALIFAPGASAGLLRVAVGNRVALFAEQPGENYAWDVNGDGRPDANCGTDTPGISFTPLQPSTAAASVSTGATTSLSVGLGTRTDQQYAALLAGAPPAVTCQARDIFLEPDKVIDCHRVVHMGIVEVRGCLHRVLSLRELPAAERDALLSYANRLLTPLQEEFFHPNFDDSSNDAFLAGLISRTNVYVSDGVIVNGVALEAVDGTRVVTAEAIGAILGADTRVTVGGIRLAARPDFVLDARRQSGGRLKLGRFERSGGRGEIGGFALSGGIGVTLVAGGSELGVELELPAFLAGDAQPTTAHVSGDGTLFTEGIQLGPFSAELGGVGVQEVMLTLHDASSWSGQGSVCLFDDVCVRMDPEHKGGIEIADGDLVFAGADVHFPTPVPVAPGVEMTHIGFRVGLHPTVLGGSIGLRAISLLDVDGDAAFAFPTADEPFVLTPEWVGGFPAKFYGRSFSTPTMAAGGNVSLVLPDPLPNLHLGGGYALYSWPGYFALGGHADIDILDVVTLEGGIDGEFNAANGRFNVSGHINICLVDYLCGSGLAAISSQGAGGCIGGTGGGVQWARMTEPFIWIGRGCRWTRFTDDNVASAASARRTLRVHADRPRVVRLDGAGGAPAVRVTGVGADATSPAGAGVAHGARVSFLRSPRLKATLVRLERPGDYTITTIPGGPPIARVSHAYDQPEARISARITRGGLRYDVRRRAEQVVTFVEHTRSGRVREIGRVRGGGRGTLRYRPARGLHTITAEIELAGLPTGERITVIR